jgi:hypothetical protein
MFTIRQKIVKQGPASGHSARQVAFADKCFRTSSTSTSTRLIIQVPIRSGHRLPELNVNLVFLTVFGVQERFSDFQQGQNPLVRSKAICEF